MEDSLAYKYFFIHKSGRKIIAQSSAEFYTLQGFESSSAPDWIRKAAKELRHNTHYRSAYKEYHNYLKDFRKVEDALNKFWDGARGMEKFYSITSGHVGCPLRRFLYEMMNQAMVEGDRAKYDKARNMWPKHQLLLPANI